ncbi:MAG: ABC transporter substrate-binding protein [Desulfobacterales bacterium]|nr:ABC transporter substrate-binding protein [Desulfobacterales bacterium]
MTSNQRLILLSLSALVLPGMLFLPQVRAQKPVPKIAWFCSSAKSGFWPIAELFVFAAAEDLGAKVQLYGYGDNPMMIVTKVEEVLASERTRPDAILFHNYKGKGRQVLELSEKFKVPAFVFNAGFSPLDKVGAPRETFKHWIGVMLPDDAHAGYILARHLMARARKMNKKGRDGRRHMVALEGNRSSEASNARVKGFEKAIEGSEFVNHQYFHSKWREHLAYEAFNLSTIRYPDVSVFWTASDSMAVGVIKAAEHQGWVPGKDFITGGIDLLPHTQSYLTSGQMAVSVGGHYVEGAWALIALYDYLMGIDFAPFDGVCFSTKMVVHNSSEFHKLGDLRHKLRRENIDKIDFRRFSRVYTRGIKKYHFDFKALFE